ncbi:MAG: NUDIX domain-containing protein [Bacteroidales bacterium]|nr:NUDIX domain-containing protein [Bacteroidales bacterium]
MIELVYPLDPAPLIGPEADASEIVPVVDENGLVIGRASREYCHAGEKTPFKPAESPENTPIGGETPSKPADSLLHPVVHLQIIDRYSRFFLQHRSANKETFPNRWDTAVGGHVAYGEYYQEALFREAGEELGLFDFNPQYLDNYIAENEGDREMVGLYITVGAFDLHPDNYEVSEGRYWTIEEIEANIGKDVFTPEFENEFAQYKDRILALL